MNFLIRLCAQAVARGIERAMRARERVGDPGTLRIGNLNEALAPLFLALLVWGLGVLLAVVSVRSKNPPGRGFVISVTIGITLIGGLLFRLGVGRVLWLRIDDTIRLVRLFSVRRYGAADVKRWGFLYTRSDLRHEPPVCEASFRIELADGAEFERIVAPHVAERIAAAMDGLTRAPVGAGRRRGTPGRVDALG